MPVAGKADLPLHGGHVPRWLAEIMKRMARAILAIMLEEYRPPEVLRRFANPLWFQALNNAIGMDWDSSGSTTVTIAIVKDVLRELKAGIQVAGGKGRAGINVPKELELIGEELGLTSSKIRNLILTSKLGAKVDSALIQDGYQLYHHAIMISERGEWVIIQQGMNVDRRMARRYHLAWYLTEDVTVEPHEGAASNEVLEPLNLSSRESLRVRGLIRDLINEGPSRVAANLREVNAILKGIKPLVGGELPRPVRKGLPYYRPVRLTPQLLKVLREAYEVRPTNFKEVLTATRVGAETLRALSLVSELIYREPPPLRDLDVIPFSPFKYAFTIGGKDGIPFPVKRKLALEVISELEEVIRRAKLGDREKLRAFRSLRKLAPPDVYPV